MKKSDNDAKTYSGEISPARKPGWILTFHDEFDGPTLDAAKWDAHYRNNREIPANYELKDGILHLRMEKDNPKIRPDGKGRVSGMETRKTPGNFAQQYGWFEVRARSPKGSGLCAAFWLVPLDSGYAKLKSDGGSRASENECMEIDIFEQLGREPNANNFTVHFGRSYNEGHKWEGKRGEFPFDLTQDFHIYTLEWNKKFLIWYVDGKEVHRSDKAAQTPFFIRLSFYHGDDSWRGKVDPAMPYPRDFEVDYVRVYKKADTNGDQ